MGVPLDETPHQPNNSNPDPNTTTASSQPINEERLCRFCLHGEDDTEGALISPCGCRGDQKWVHTECLRRWQRSVLVTQPTHPAFYEDDDRHQVCNVCRQRFSAQPPTRAELMAGFTGPELAALLDVGCLIVCERRTSNQMSAAMSQNRILALIASLHHWVKGVYLITSVDEEEGSDGDDGITAVSLTRRVDLHHLPTELQAKTARALEQSRRQSTGPNHTRDNTTSNTSNTNNNTSDISSTDDDSDDDPTIPTIPTTTSTAPTAPTAPTTPTPTQTNNSNNDSAPNSPVDIQITHYIGGPCAQSLGTALCVVSHISAVEAVSLGVKIGGNQGGLWIVGKLLNVFRVAQLDATRGGQSTAQVRVHWGDARWTRTQLLGEIARGSWGMCRATAGDVFAHNQQFERSQWSTLQDSERLIFAPRSEMTDRLDSDDEQNQPTPDPSQPSLDEQMARHRAELRRRVLVQAEREREREHARGPQRSPSPSDSGSEVSN